MIFPIPVTANYFEEVYVLKGQYKMKSVYDFYQSADTNSLDFFYELSESYAEEEYSILVNQDGIKITYAKEVGRFRALTSVYQLIENGVAGCCEIHDLPQFPHRGYMLDISRGKIPTRETIFRYVDILCGLKYNEFQLYI